MNKLSPRNRYEAITTSTVLSNEDGTGTLSSFDFCHDLAVSHGVSVGEGRRGKGIGGAQHVERLDWANLYGLSYLLCTVNKNNLAERKILSKNGWKKLDDFRTQNSSEQEYGSIVEIWGRKMANQYPKDGLETINPA